MVRAIFWLLLFGAASLISLEARAADPWKKLTINIYPKSGDLILRGNEKRFSDDDAAKAYEVRWPVKATQSDGSLVLIRDDGGYRNSPIAGWARKEDLLKNDPDDAPIEGTVGNYYTRELRKLAGLKDDDSRHKQCILYWLRGTYLAYEDQTASARADLIDAIRVAFGMPESSCVPNGMLSDVAVHPTAKIRQPLSGDCAWYPKTQDWTDAQLAAAAQRFPGISDALIRLGRLYAEDDDSRNADAVQNCFRLAECFLKYGCQSCSGSQCRPPILYVEWAKALISLSHRELAPRRRTLTESLRTPTENLPMLTRSLDSGNLRILTPILGSRGLQMLTQSLQMLTKSLQMLTRSLKLANDTFVTDARKKLDCALGCNPTWSPIYLTYGELLFDRVVETSPRGVEPNEPPGATEADQDQLKLVIDWSTQAIRWGSTQAIRWDQNSFDALYLKAEALRWYAATLQDKLERRNERETPQLECLFRALESVDRVLELQNYQHDYDGFILSADICGDIGDVFRKRGKSEDKEYASVWYKRASRFARRGAELAANKGSGVQSFFERLERYYERKLEAPPPRGSASILFYFLRTLGALVRKGVESAATG